MIFWRFYPGVSFSWWNAVTGDNTDAKTLVNRDHYIKAYRITLQKKKTFAIRLYLIATS